MLLTLAGRGGTVARENAGLAAIPKDKRPLLRRLGVTIGALDVFVPALLKPGRTRALLRETGADLRPVHAAMDAVIAGAKQLPAGYRRAGSQAIRVDMAEKLFRAAHEARARANGRAFQLDPALATSMGLAAGNSSACMRDAGFRAARSAQTARRRLRSAGAGPWSWRAAAQGPRAGNWRRATRDGRRLCRRLPSCSAECGSTAALVPALRQDAQRGAAVDRRGAYPPQRRAGDASGPAGGRRRRADACRCAPESCRSRSSSCPSGAARRPKREPATARLTLADAIAIAGAKTAPEEGPGQP